MNRKYTKKSTKYLRKKSRKYFRKNKMKKTTKKFRKMKRGRKIHTPSAAMVGGMGTGSESRKPQLNNIRILYPKPLPPSPPPPSPPPAPPPPSPPPTELYQNVPSTPPNNYATIIKTDYLDLMDLFKSLFNVHCNINGRTLFLYHSPKEIYLKINTSGALLFHYLSENDAPHIIMRISRNQYTNDINFLIDIVKNLI